MMKACNRFISYLTVKPDRVNVSAFTGSFFIAGTDRRFGLELLHRH